MKIKDQYWELIYANMAARQTLFEWQFAAHKAGKDTTKLDELVKNSQEQDNFICHLMGRVERQAALLHKRNRELFDMAEELEKLKQINEL